MSNGRTAPLSINIHHAGVGTATSLNITQTIGDNKFTVTALRHLYDIQADLCIGVARGCSGCTCTPRAEKKIRRNLQGKLVSAPPGTGTPRQSKSQFFGHFLLGGGDLKGRSG